MWQQATWEVKSICHSTSVVSLRDEKGEFQQNCKSGMFVSEKLVFAHLIFWLWKAFSSFFHHSGSQLSSLIKQGSIRYALFFEAYLCPVAKSAFCMFVCFGIFKPCAGEAMVTKKSHLRNYIWDGNWSMSLLGFRIFRVTIQLEGSPKSCCSIKEPWSPCLAIQDSSWHLLPLCMFQASRVLCP